MSSNYAGALLLDEHEGMLTYQVIGPDTTMGGLFNILKSNQARLNIEDYTVSYDCQSDNPRTDFHQLCSNSAEQSHKIVLFIHFKTFCYIVLNCISIFFNHTSMKLLTSSFYSFICSFCWLDWIEFIVLLLSKYWTEIPNLTFILVVGYIVINCDNIRFWIWTMIFFVVECSAILQILGVQLFYADQSSANLLHIHKTNGVIFRNSLLRTKIRKTLLYFWHYEKWRRERYFRRNLDCRKSLIGWKCCDLWENPADWRKTAGCLIIAVLLEKLL